jgi:hypothetical protein
MTKITNERLHEIVEQWAGMPSDSEQGALAGVALELLAWRECAEYDVTMDGRVFKGWNRSALDRCRRAAEALNDH